LKKSFTLIELIFTIVILSIIGIISVQILSKLYEEYIITRTINRLQSETELILDLIAKRLQYRIKESTIARMLPPNDTTITSLSTSNNSYKILEWIGYDIDSFKGYYSSSKQRVVPGWSGFVDLYSSETNKSQIKTPGSDLNITDNIVKSISDGSVSLTNSNMGLIFKEMQAGFDIFQYGWNCFSETNPSNCANRSYVYDVKCPVSGCSDILEVNPTFNGKEITEQYYLTWSAYAIVPQNNELILYYNYRPWKGEKYSDGKSSILAKNLSVFRFRQIDQVVRLKICLYKKITNNYSLSFCKEKVVY